MSVLRWDPFRDAMKWMFEEGVERPWRAMRPREVALAVDMYETDAALVVTADMPGVKPEDLDISITGAVLTIKGETKPETEVKRESYHRQERRYGAYSRSVALPTPVNADQAEAKFKDGVLTLTIPKAEEAKPKVIKVQGK